MRQTTEIKKTRKSGLVISVRVKPHLAQFLKIEEAQNSDENDVIVLTQTRIIPSYVMSRLVRKKIYFSKKDHKKRDAVIRFRVSPYYWKLGLIFITPSGENEINSFLQHMMNFKLEMYIQSRPQVQRKQSIIDFLISYGLDPDVDVNVANIKMQNDRYRQKLIGLTPK